MAENKPYKQYVNTCYEFKSFIQIRIMRSQIAPRTAFWAGLGLALLSSVFSAEAQVRRYNPSETLNVIQVPRETSSSEASKAVLAPQMRALEGTNQSVANQALERSSYVAALHNLKPASAKLGKAYVFIRPQEFSKELFDNMKEIQALSDLETEFYFQNMPFPNLAKFLQAHMADYPKDMTINIDLGGTMAAQQQAVDKSEIVYHAPDNTVQHYRLDNLNEFKTRLQNVKPGVAR